MTRIRLLGVVGISLVTMTLGAAGTADAQGVPQTAPTTTVAREASTAPTGGRAAAFLKIDGVAGESLDDKHKNWIDVTSFELRQTPTRGAGAPSTGAGAGRVAVSDIQITKVQDKSSNTLMTAMAAGTHFKTAVIELRKAGADPLNARYYRITLTDAYVTKHSLSAASGASPMPTESLTLNFTKIAFEYAPQNPDGSPGAYQTVQDGYDVKTNVRM